MQRIDARTLHGWITDGHELAILDAREEGEFGAAHLFWAVPCPLSRAELLAPALLPRRSARAVCVDDGSGLAERLAAILAGLGCTDLATLDGGTPAWQSAGFALFSGINVPSKAFGEWVEHHYGTRSVDALELKSWIDAGRDMVVLDSRTFDEFQAMSIPAAMSVPGGELAYRIADLAPNPNTLVVVNCAGRTRSILGAESLRQAGIPNQVVALRNGTMGWELAGLLCSHGSGERYPAGRPASAGLGLARAEAFAARSGVAIIDSATLTAFELDQTRSLYVLDVRDPAEFAAGHRPGSGSAPGGQLIQATDRWIAVRGARIVLLDDDGVRARMSAAWLRQMGHRDVSVAEASLGSAHDGYETPSAKPGITAAQLRDSPDSLVIDLARSLDYRAGHIPGSIWAIRTRLAQHRDALAAASHVVLSSPDGRLAELALAEAQSLTAAQVQLLQGGSSAWRALGMPMASGRTVPDDAECVDVYLRPYDRNAGVAEAMQAYLSWEIDLVQQIDRDGTIAFGLEAVTAR